MQCKSRPLVGLAAVVAAGASPAALAASFDCGAASTEVERMICSTPTLETLDLKLATAYRQALQRAGNASARLRDDQRGWLDERDRCGEITCLEHAYEERIASLTADTDAALGPAETTRLDDRVRLTQSGPNVEIEAIFPRLRGDEAGTQAANRAIEAEVTEEVGKFRNEYLRFLDESDGIHVGPPWSLTIDFDDVYAGPRFWTIDLVSYHYSGGAHGGQEHIALVIERESGQRVPPTGLFRPDSVWLERLSDYCYQDLRRREPFEPDDDWLQRGTAPEAENYQVLLPVDDGLGVVFGQYQIGPYVIGIFEVRVPYEVLASVLNPDLFPSQAAPK